MKKILFILSIIISSVVVAQTSNDVKAYITDATKNSATVTLTVNDLVKTGKLSVTDKTYMLQSFVYTDGKAKIEVELAKFNDAVIKIIQSKKAGDKITFENIVLIDPVGNALPGTNIEVTIK